MAQRLHLDPVERRATADIIADLIRERIMDGSFAPGEQLGEVQLAEQLDVSRGPVREALQRLIQEGLLDSRPHRGVFVVDLGADDVADVYRARLAVEREAIRVVCDTREPEALDRLDALVERMGRAAEGGRWARLAELDREFHQVLVDGAGSRRLSRMFRTLITETRLCLAGLRPAYPRRADLVDEHATLLRTLRKGESDNALTQIDEHLDAAIRSLLNRPGD